MADSDPQTPSLVAPARRLAAALDAVEAALAEPGDEEAVVQRLAAPVRDLVTAARETRNG